MDTRHHVVVLGGGVAGLELASRLSALALRVTLVDREPAHIWKPMLHTIAAGTSDIYQQQTIYIAQARRRGFTFQPGQVQIIDRVAKHVVLDPIPAPHVGQLVPERRIAYDTLVVALGSRANDFGTPGASDYCRTIDSRAQALAFNEEARLRLIRSTVDQTQLRIAIVGAGATGVELAAELVQLASQADHYGARNARERVTITLLEGCPRILAAFPECVSENAHRRLVELGVDVRPGAKVAQVSDNGVQLSDGTLIPADLRVWAAGVRAPGVLASLQGIEMTRADQIVVDANLRCPQDPAIFAIGDAASHAPDGAAPLPPTAQVAHQQAGYLLRHLPGLIRGEQAPPFRFRDSGSLVSLGGYGAYGSLGKFGFFRGGFIKGRVAQIGHVLLYRSHQARLHGFWRGSLMWLVDMLNARLRPPIRLD